MKSAEIHSLVFFIGSDIFISLLDAKRRFHMSLTWGLERTYDQVSAAGDTLPWPRPAPAVHAASLPSILDCCN